MKTEEPRGYFTATLPPIGFSVDVETIKRQLKELSDHIRDEEELIALIVPKGAKIVVMTSDHRILATKSGLSKTP